MGKVGRKHNEKKPEFVTAFSIYEGEVHSATFRKTKARFIIDDDSRVPAFDYRARFQKEELSFSKKEAIEKELNKWISRKSSLLLQLKKAQEHIDCMKSLLLKEQNEKH